MVPETILSLNWIVANKLKKETYPFWLNDRAGSATLVRVLTTVVNFFPNHVSQQVWSMAEDVEPGWITLCIAPGHAASLANTLARDETLPGRITLVGYLLVLASGASWMSLSYEPTFISFIPNICKHKLSASVLSTNCCLLCKHQHGYRSVVIDIHLYIINRKWFGHIIIFQQSKPGLSGHDLNRHA